MSLIEQLQRDCEYDPEGEGSVDDLIAYKDALEDRLGALEEQVRAATAERDRLAREGFADKNRGEYVAFTNGMLRVLGWLTGRDEIARVDAPPAPEAGKAEHRIEALIRAAENARNHDDAYWEAVATGQDSEEAEASGALAGQVAGLTAALAVLRGEDGADGLDLYIDPDRVQVIEDYRAELAAHDG